VIPASFVCELPVPCAVDHPPCTAGDFPVMEAIEGVGEWGQKDQKFLEFLAKIFRKILDFVHP